MSQGNSPLTLNITQKQSGENLTGASKVTGSPLTTQKAESPTYRASAPLGSCWRSAGGLQVACSLQLHRESCQRLAKSSKHFVNTIQPFQISRFQFRKYGSKLSSRKLSLLCHRTPQLLSTLSIQTDVVSSWRLSMDVLPRVTEMRFWQASTILTPH